MSENAQEALATQLRILTEMALDVLMELGWRERYEELGNGTPEPIHDLDRYVYELTGQYNQAAYEAVEGIPHWVQQREGGAA